MPTKPSADILETFPNPARRPFWIRFESADFTSLCPITGQADFANIQIEYQPWKRCLETKSLKFYLASYRNERAFNEAVTNRILDDLVRACEPRRMIVRAEFAARGGISPTITASHPDDTDA
ncbi:MAG: preQ(1) synthase [Verrucomicrobiota bacterium]|nr:preQ(1) synthase [Verrucomicrobiota bacterium]